MAATDTQCTKIRLYFRYTGEGVEEAVSQIHLFTTKHATAAAAPQWTPAGRTDKSATGSPLAPIIVDYRFEARQDFIAKIVIDEAEPNSQVLSVPFQLGHVVSARGGTLTVAGPGELSFVITAAASTVNPLDNVTLEISARHLKGRNIGSSGSDAFFKLYHLLPNGARDLLHTSSVMKGCVDATWPRLPPLNSGDLSGRTWADPALQVECWSKGVFSDTHLGVATFSIAEILEAWRADACAAVSRELVKASDPSKKYGTLYVHVASQQHFPTFTELLAAGMNVNVAVAIDFTKSNGDRAMPSSLHYLDPATPNQYVRAISAVCDIVLEYDNDKLVPAFGFGAQLPNGQVSHCFHLNAQPDPNVFGVQGILDSYSATLRSVQLSGPTNFAPTIRQAEQAARGTPNTYTILLIITDGVITDTDATVDAIVACGNAPMSIVIIGVGNADFTLMNMLDGDEERLTSSRGERCLRDLVQFVPFRDFATAPREVLAAEVLEEVPRQVEEWAQLTNRVAPVTIMDPVLHNTTHEGTHCSAPR